MWIEGKSKFLFYIIICQKLDTLGQAHHSCAQTPEAANIVFHRFWYERLINSLIHDSLIMTIVHSYFLFSFRGAFSASFTLSQGAKS